VRHSVASLKMSATMIEVVKVLKGSNPEVRQENP